MNPVPLWAPRFDYQCGLVYLSLPFYREVINSKEPAQHTTDEKQNTDTSKFLGIHPIDLTGGNHPILTPHQFQFPVCLGQPVQ